MKLAKAQGFALDAAKKATKGNPETEFPGAAVVRNLYENRRYLCSAQLLAGTAWLFSHPSGDQNLDYLFIDEAGQVALAGSS